MLHQVLQEIEQANEPLTIQEISRRLQLDAGIVSDMVAIWVRKGRLTADDAPTHDPIQHCGSDCRGPAECHFIAKMPGTYTLHKR
jgi:hypothetical protein